MVWAEWSSQTQLPWDVLAVILNVPRSDATNATRAIKSRWIVRGALVRPRFARNLIPPQSSHCDMVTTEPFSFGLRLSAIRDKCCHYFVLSERSLIIMGMSFCSLTPSVTPSVWTARTWRGLLERPAEQSWTAGGPTTEQTGWRYRQQSTGMPRIKSQWWNSVKEMHRTEGRKEKQKERKMENDRNKIAWSKRVQRDYFLFYYVNTVKQKCDVQY